MTIKLELVTKGILNAILEQLWRQCCSKGLLVKQAIIATVVATSFLPTSVLAFDPSIIPPITQLIDQNRVNLTTGFFDLTIASVSIGPSGPGNLQYDFEYNGSQAPVGWGQGASPNSHWNGYIFISSAGITVVIKNQPTLFVWEGADGYQPQDGSGATVTTDGTNYTFTAHDGTVGYFTPVNNTCPIIPGYCSPAQLTKLTYPSGMSQTFTYRVSGGAIVTSSVTNNLGYQLKFNYRCDTYTTGFCFYQPTEVIAINNAVEYCDPTANSCPTITANAWSTLRVSYDPSNPNIVLSVTDPANYTTSFGGDASTSYVTLPSGRRYSMSFAPPFNLTVNDGTGAWQYAREVDDSSTTTTITDPLGHQRVVVVNLDSGKIRSDTVDPGGLNLQTKYAYDSHFRLQTVTHPEGNYEQYSYDSRGDVTEMRQYEKPSVGSDYIHTSASFSASCDASNFRICNQPTSTIDANGNTTDYTYDVDGGGVLTVTAPAVNGGRPVTQFTYQALYAWYNTSGSGTAPAATPVYMPTQTAACAFAQTSNWGVPNWGSFSWGNCTASASQRITTMHYPSGSSSAPTNLQPDHLTVAAGSGPAATDQGMSYDEHGNLTLVTGPLSGQATIYAFDFDHNKLGTIGPDPDGSGPLGYPASQVVLDTDGRLYKTYQGTATSQTFSAWPSNFTPLAEQTIAYNNSFFGLDAQDTSYIGTDVNTPTSLIQHSYNGARLGLCSAVRVTASTFGSLPDACTPSTSSPTSPDQITYNTYDNANRVSNVQTGHGSGSPITEVTNTYTGNSKLNTVQDGNGNQSAYIYDAWDRLSAIRYPTKTIPGTPDTTDYENWLYDNNGNAVSHTGRDGETFVTTYDALNRIIQKINPATGNTYIYYNYDFFGDLLSAHFDSPAGYGTDFTYDALGRRLTETTSTASYRRTVSSTYDAAGNRTALTYPDGGTISYNYDLLNRISQILRAGSPLATYSYDDLGRTTGISRPNGTSTIAVYNPADAGWHLNQNLSSPSQSVQFCYTVNPGGQMGQRTINNSMYAYSAPAFSASYTPNGLNQYDSVNGTTFHYDTNGNLTYDGARTMTYDFGSRLASVSGSASMTLTYDAAGRLNRTSSGSNENYTYDGSSLIAEYDDSGNMLRRYVPGAGADDNEVWYEGSDFSSPHWLYTDERGSVIGASDASGSATTYNYNVTGEPGGGWGASPPAPIFRYTGQAALSAVNLYYFKGRMYDPALGRFLQADPIGYDGGLNLYAYADNDPANNIDPFGLDSCPEGTECVVVTGTEISSGPIFRLGPGAPTAPPLEPEISGPARTPMGTNWLPSPGQVACAAGVVAGGAAIGGGAGAIGGGAAGLLVGAPTGPGAAITAYGGAAAGAELGANIGAGAGALAAPFLCAGGPPPGAVLMSQSSNGGRCQGAAAGGCQSGGSYGTGANYRVGGRNLCADCAVKDLGIGNEPRSVITRILNQFLRRVGW